MYLLSFKTVCSEVWQLIMLSFPDTKAEDAKTVTKKSEAKIDTLSNKKFIFHTTSYILIKISDCYNHHICLMICEHGKTYSAPNLLLKTNNLSSKQLFYNAK